MVSFDSSLCLFCWMFLGKLTNAAPVFRDVQSHFSQSLVTNRADVAKGGRPVLSESETVRYVRAIERQAEVLKILGDCHPPRVSLLGGTAAKSGESFPLLKAVGKPLM